MLANGSSFCIILIEKVSFDGTPLTGDEHNNEIFLRTTGGALTSLEGRPHIRSIHLNSGQAELRLVSERTPKVVTLTALGASPLSEKATVEVEFIATRT